MNRNVKKYLIIGIVIIALFLLAIYVPHVVLHFELTRVLPSLPWLLPSIVAIIAVFIAPIVTIALSNWDIHFYFQELSDGNLVVIVSNLGTTPFAFNRLQFNSGKRYRILGKREFYPQSGLFGNKLLFHGTDTLTQGLHQDTICTLKKGVPTILIIGGHQGPEYLRHFKVNSKIYLSLYYEGTQHRVYSQRIPSEIVMNMIQSSNQD